VLAGVCILLVGGAAHVHGDLVSGRAGRKAAEVAAAAVATACFM
jgi:hypothetical protein